MLLVYFCQEIAFLREIGLEAHMMSHVVLRYGNTTNVFCAVDALSV